MKTLPAPRPRGWDVLWDPSVSTEHFSWILGIPSRYLISSAKGWHLLLRDVEKAGRHSAEPKKVFENNWVEHVDLDIWRKTEESNRRSQGKRTNKEVNRHQKWANPSAWPGCLRGDARFCHLLRTPERGPVCPCEALGWAPQSRLSSGSRHWHQLHPGAGCVYLTLQSRWHGRGDGHLRLLRVCAPIRRSWTDPSLGLLRTMVQAQPRAREITGQKGKNNAGRMGKWIIWRKECVTAGFFAIIFFFLSSKEKKKRMIKDANIKIEEGDTSI